MIYISADDYGINGVASEHIQRCIDKGKLNKVSVFPNFDKVDLEKIAKDKNIRLALHLNLVEGRCMAPSNEIDMLADEEGNLKHTFSGLFMISLLHRKRFSEQVYKEIKAQVLFWKSVLPQDMPFCIDSHQHTHMIPSVFRAMMKVLHDENIKPDYLRIPKEPMLPYIKTPSLYHTYRAVNIIKQWLLNFLWLFNRGKAKNIPTAYFFGILFSGKMDEKRVGRVLPHYIKLANKKKKDIEVLFHPGYLTGDETDLESKNVAFGNFYLSENRKTEFDSVMKITERSVL